MQGTALANVDSARQGFGRAQVPPLPPLLLLFPLATLVPATEPRHPGAASRRRGARVCLLQGKRVRRGRRRRRRCQALALARTCIVMFLFSDDAKAPVAVRPRTRAALATHAGRQACKQASRQAGKTPPCPAPGESDKGGLLHGENQGGCAGAAGAAGAGADASPSLTCEATCGRSKGRARKRPSSASLRSNASYMRSAYCSITPPGLEALYVCPAGHKPPSALA